MSLRRFLSSVSMVAVTAFALTAFAQPVRAQEEDDGPNFMTRMLGSVGLLQVPGPAIDTSERPPLVVPPLTNYTQPNVAPNADLTPRAQSQQNPWDFSAPRQDHLPPAAANDRPPQQTVALPLPQDQNTVRQRNPNFPVDPEVRAEQKKAKKKKGPYIMAEDPFYGGRLLKHGEMQRTGAVKQSPEVVHQDNRSIVSDVPVIGDLWKKKDAQQPMTFNGEPERQTLTQPPSGYLTPSANAPYGVVSADPKAKPQVQPHANFPQSDGELPKPF